MKLVKLLRNLLRPLLLGGWALRQWALWKCRRLDRAYLSLLAQERAASHQPPFDPPLACAVRPDPALKTILFIGDCSWEPNELFPELRKIAALEYLDLGPSLKANQVARPHETVSRAIEAFVTTARSWEPDVIL